MKLTQAGVAGVLAALALPAVATAHPSVYVDDRAQVEDLPGSGTFMDQTRYVVANHGFTYVLRESNQDTDQGVFDYKSIPGALRAGKDWGWLLANGTTGAQAHAQCAETVLDDPDAIKSWQGADPFYAYVPFQKESAGLEDDPADWIPVVKELTGVDLATETDAPGACAAVDGTYIPADETQSSNAAFNSGLIEHTAAPLEAEITTLTDAKTALQGLLDAARAEIAKLSAAPAETAIGVALPSARIGASNAAKVGITVALTGAAGAPVKAYLKLGERRGRRMKLRSSVLASARTTFAADGRATVTLKPGKRARKALRKLDRTIAMTVRARSGDRIATSGGTLTG